MFPTFIPEEENSFRFWKVESFWNTQMTDKAKILNNTKFYIPTSEPFEMVRYIHDLWPYQISHISLQLFIGYHIQTKSDNGVVTLNQLWIKYFFDSFMSSYQLQKLRKIKPKLGSYNTRDGEHAVKSLNRFCDGNWFSITLFPCLNICVKQSCFNLSTFPKYLMKGW
jgi:hypothetical protein